MLTRAQVEQFLADGFLAVPSLLEEPAIQEARALLDPLFERFGELPTEVTRDLGASDSHREAAARIAEINRPTLLDGRLMRSQVYHACRGIAAQLGGRRMAYAFDHAIYKAPFNQRETPWHQDQAYAGHDRPLKTIHFWVPLQDATNENGCMEFVPGSHRRGLLQHARHLNGHVLSAQVTKDARVVTCPLTVGGFTIHSPLTLHHTGPNTTAMVRRAWILHFGPWGRAAKFSPWILASRFLRHREHG